MDILDQRPNLIKSKEAIEEQKYQMEVRREEYAIANRGGGKLMFKGLAFLDSKVKPS
jgi:hypothetical protein